MHSSQCASNLLGRVARLQIASDLTPQRRARLQPALDAWLDQRGVSPLVCSIGTVTARYQETTTTAMRLRANPAMALQLPAERRSRTPKLSRNPPRLEPHR